MHQRLRHKYCVPCFSADHCNSLAMLKATLWHYFFSEVRSAEGKPVQLWRADRVFEAAGRPPDVRHVWALAIAMAQASRQTSCLKGCARQCACFRCPPRSTYCCKALAIAGWAGEALAASSYQFVSWDCMTLLIVLHNVLQGQHAEALAIAGRAVDVLAAAPDAAPVAAMFRMRRGAAQFGASY